MHGACAAADSPLTKAGPNSFTLQNDFTRGKPHVHGGFHYVNDAYSTVANGSPAVRRFLVVMTFLSLAPFIFSSPRSKLEPPADRRSIIIPQRSLLDSTCLFVFNQKKKSLGPSAGFRALETSQYAVCFAEGCEGKRTNTVRPKRPDVLDDGLFSGSASSTCAITTLKWNSIEAPQRPNCNAQQSKGQRWNAPPSRCDPEARPARLAIEDPQSVLAKKTATQKPGARAQRRTAASTPQNVAR